jgi:anti-anti-sigma factor
VGQHACIEVEAHSFDASIVTLCGEHDLSSTPQITRAFEEIGARRVLVDLSHCIFIDSSVVSALLRASEALRAQGGQLSLVISGDRHQAVRRLIELMRVDRLLPTYETRAAAITHIDSAQPTTDVRASMRLRAISEIIDQSVSETDDRRRAA